MKYLIISILFCTTAFGGMLSESFETIDKDKLQKTSHKGVYTIPDYLELNDFIMSPSTLYQNGKYVYGNPLIIDMNEFKGSNNFGKNGKINNRNKVLDGSTYLAFSNKTIQTYSIQFKQKQNYVGAYFTGMYKQPIKMRSYSASEMLNEITIYPNKVNKWKNGYFQLDKHFNKLIDRVEFEGTDYAIDNVYFEPSNVPVPSTLLLILFPFLLMFIKRPYKSV